MDIYAEVISGLKDVSMSRGLWHGTFNTKQKGAF